MAELSTVTERNGRTTTGELVYASTYPHAVEGKDGRVKEFERRIQRCALVTSEGRLWHFTVPLSLDLEGGSNV